MMRDSLISKKISLISFCAMICVIWWHCNCGSHIEQLFIPAVCVWSVPWFFFASGVFFRLSIERKGILPFLEGKIKSLFVPYLIWCALGIFICFDAVGSGSVLDLYAISLSRASPKWNHALWYLRCLMFLSLFGAMLYGVVRCLQRGKWWVFSSVFLAGILVINRFVVHIYGPGSSPLYFIAGVLLAGRLFCQMDICASKRTWVLGVCCLITAVVCRTIWFWEGFRFSVSGGTVIANVSTIFFICALWMLSDRLAGWVFGRGWGMCCEMTAFVYFLHAPINVEIKHLCCQFNHDVVFVLLIILLPICYLSIAGTLRQSLPRVYGILSGGR